MKRLLAALLFLLVLAVPSPALANSLRPVVPGPIVPLPCPTAEVTVGGDELPASVELPALCRYLESSVQGPIGGSGTIITQAHPDRQEQLLMAALLLLERLDAERAAGGHGAMHHADLAMHGRDAEGHDWHDAALVLLLGVSGYLLGRLRGLQGEIEALRTGRS